ncbi:trypsin-like serine protease [Xenorhabdus indica]|uniref:trypsin-like serine protease n=1 Tax=Xenorhabdus indica TaxID=333964 RepID=UPI001656FB49|nr:trypsin-like serine protease [Xenorhabdus indica]MBC8943760.1 trypsin [Xenorhabdus indica]
MIVIRAVLILLILFHCSNSFSDSSIKSLPLKAIAGGEESCKDINSDKCKSWVVSIYYVDQKNEEKMLCTGSLIAPNYVLTAAHCEEVEAKNYYVISSYDKNKKVTASTYNFIKMEIPGAFGPDPHDVAILKLDKPLELDGKYGRIRRFFNYDEAYEKLDSSYYQSSIYGYGYRGIDETTGEPKKNSDNAQYYADVKIISPARDFFNNQGLVIAKNKKAGLKPGVIQHGDSGGPIIWNDTIVGVSSFGFEVPSVKQKTDDKRDYPFFVVSDVTGKYNKIGFIDKFFPGKWFSQTMKQIWIDTPDWNAHLRKRDGDILVKGWGRPKSAIELIYSINDGAKKSFKCKDIVDNSGEWKCHIPNNDFFTEKMNKEEGHNVIITAKESSDNLSKSVSWREDSVQAKIPSIAKEFGIVYPADKSTVFTKNFTIRGYADPGSAVELELQSTVSDDDYYTQDELCKGITDGKTIETTDYGFWSCTINYSAIEEIEDPSGETEWNYKITAIQKTNNLNIYDQVNILFQPEESNSPNIKLIKDNLYSNYSKMLPFDLGLDNKASFFCFFNQSYLYCNDVNDKISRVYLPNKKIDGLNAGLRQFNIFAIQKIEHVDPLDPILWNKSSELGGYLSPTFKDKNDINNPREINSKEQQDQIFSGYGGDRQKYIWPNGDVILPSEYSIKIKEEDKNTFSPVKLGEHRFFSSIPIYSGQNNHPVWEISLPYYSLKDGLYYVEVADKYYPLGLEKFKKYWGGSPPERSYFRIITPEIKITTPFTGETSTVGTSSFLSGSSNVPGDEVDVKRRRIDPFSPKLEGGNQGLVKETSICTGAVVSDNGNWQCDRPIIFTKGTYELTAELIKEGKVVATDVTRFTVKDKNDDDDNPEKKLEIDNPKDNSTVDPDNPIRLSGKYGGSGGSGGGGFGGFLSSLAGAVFGGVESLVGSALSSGLGFFWEFTIMPGAILGGDTYTLGIQETKNGVHVGDPVTLHFTIPIRITSPAKGAQYRLYDGITIEGQGTPGQLVLVAAAKEFLPQGMTLPMSNEGIICFVTVDSSGKWACSHQPALTAINEGVFSLYAAQYKKISSTEFGGTYERTSQVTRKYEVSKTKIQITLPSHGAKITTLPFTITGTGEKGAKVYIKGFGGTKDCNTEVDASGKWSCGPYQPEEGKYSVVAEQFIDNTLNSSSSVSFEIQTKTIKPVVITQPHNGGVYQHLENILPKGTGEPGTVVCLDKKALSQICQNGVTVDDKGHWEWIDGLDTSVRGEQKLVATAFLDKVRQSTAKVTFEIIPAPGEIKLTVKSPKEAEIIKTPAYTFSGTMPGNAKTVTVKAFGGHDDCSAKLNRENYTWTCGPYSSVPGDYDVTIVDDAGSQINRSFKVRYGANLQMRVLKPAEGEQIATPTYTINGKGQVGARITVSLAGKQICEVDVDENQDWVCPDEIESKPGDYRILAQQWVDNEPSGKPVTRNFEVIYISDITINPIAKPICTASSASKIAKSSEEFTPMMKSNETISIPITGIATKGAYISLKATPANGDSQNCGPVQVSKTDGNWRCSLHNVQPGIYQVEATQSITVNGQLHKRMKEDNVDASVLSISAPPEGSIKVSYHPPIDVKVTGDALPKMKVSYNVQNDEDFFCYSILLPKVPFPSGDTKKGSIVADDQGYWSFDAKLSQFGKQNITVSAQFCGQFIQVERKFCYHPYMR